jgi:hypothetical protein
MRTALSVLLMLCAISSFLEGETIDTVIRCDDTKYTVEYSFMTVCDESLLLNICYDYGHLVDFAVQKNLTIGKLAEGPDWHNVVYRYHYLFYRNSTTYTKRLLTDSSMVTFEMIDFTQNLGLFSKVTESRGHYRIERDGEGHRVEYYQETVLDREITGFYLDHLMKSTNEFLSSFENYVRSHEPEFVE